MVGDAIVRVLEYLGHTVIRAAHLGDWGTQFGMLIEHALDIGEQATAEELEAGEFTAFYQAARAKFDAEPASATGPGSGSSSCRPATSRPCGCGGCSSTTPGLPADVYARLDITLTDADMDPESFYNPVLADVSGELEARASPSSATGACAFPPGFSGRDGPRAAHAAQERRRLRLRQHRRRGDSVPARGPARRPHHLRGRVQQHQHFELVFAVARQAGRLTDRASAEHAVIGLMTGPGGQRLQDPQRRAGQAGGR